jgi:hypothetical protein
LPSGQSRRSLGGASRPGTLDRYFEQGDRRRRRRRRKHEKSLGVKKKEKRRGRVKNEPDSA